MEDVLEVYQRPHDPGAPSYAWMKRRNSSSKRPRADRRPGRAKVSVHDYEYDRNGVANLFMCSLRWKAGGM